ncbi:MAG TPA: hypothetical protein DEG71_10425 [Clostridiales bacterium]|nr:hypothetical protein [Clostridiales bacterium]
MLNNQIQKIIDNIIDAQFTGWIPELKQFCKNYKRYTNDDQFKLNFHCVISIIEKGLSALEFLTDRPIAQNILYQNLNKYLTQQEIDTLKLEIMNGTNNNVYFTSLGWYFEDFGEY